MATKFLFRHSQTCLTNQTLAYRRFANSAPLYSQRPLGFVSPSRRPLLFFGGITCTVALAVTYNAAFIHNDGPDVHLNSPPTRRPPPLRELARTYIVYGLCSFPKLVDWSPTILSTLLSIPVVSSITKAAVRVTLFDQFVGGDTAADTIPLLHRLRREGKGCLFAYSVEVDEDEAANNVGTKPRPDTGSSLPPHKEAVEEMLRAIDVAAHFEDGNSSADSAKGGARKTWVAVKMTALLPSASALVSLSRHLVKTRQPLLERVPFPDVPRPSDLDVLDIAAPSASSNLTAEEIRSLKDLHEDLVRICDAAQRRGVKVIIDAEYSWYTPATDAYALALMRRFNDLSSLKAPDKNIVQPLVYQTFQAYLRRTPAYLAHSLEEARASNFALGVKLVRGAYHPHELAAFSSSRSPSSNKASAEDQELARLCLSSDPVPPVLLTKAATDACYNGCAAILVDAVAGSLHPAPPRRVWPFNQAATRPPVVGVLFGTHNRASCDHILSLLVEKRLATAYGGVNGVVNVDARTADRVVFAQLYGMHDHLTDYLVDRTRSPSPVVLKYVPYGGLKEVMPYLSRRAIENKSVLFEGAAADERRRAWDQIYKRIFG